MRARPQARARARPCLTWQGTHGLPECGLRRAPRARACRQKTNQHVTPSLTLNMGARLQVEDEPGGDALAHDVHEEVGDGQQPHVRVLHAVLVQQAPQAALGRAAWRRRAAACAQRLRSALALCSAPGSYSLGVRALGARRPASTVLAQSGETGP